MIGILLVASKKVPTKKKWLQPEAPVVDDWTDVIREILVMERLTFSLRLRKITIIKIWLK